MSGEETPCKSMPYLDQEVVCQGSPTDPFDLGGSWAASLYLLGIAYLSVGIVVWTIDAMEPSTRGLVKDRGLSPEVAAATIWSFVTR